MWNLFILFFKRLFTSRANGGFGIWIPLVIVVALVFAYFRFFSSKRFTSIKPTSILKKIEYVEQLKLVTYYYEEIVVLGTSKRVEKIVDKQKKAVKKAEKDLFVLEFELVQAESKLDSINKKHFNFDEIDAQLLIARQNLEKARVLFQDMTRNIAEFNKIKKDLEGSSGFYGDKVKVAYTDFRETETLWKNNVWRGLKPKKRRTLVKDSLRQALELKKIALQGAIREEKAIRRNTLAQFHDEVKRLEDRKRGNDKLIQKIRKNAEKAYERALKDYEKANNSLADKRAKMIQAEAELEFARDQGDNFVPKLLVVVPAQITGYMDMRKLKTNAGIWDGQILEVVVPDAELDSVLITLDSTDHYELSNKLDLDLSSKGVYYDIYQQLRDALLEKEAQVKEKAIAQGILTETREMATQYIEEFGESLGFEIKFVDSIGNPIDQILAGEPGASPVPVDGLDPSQTLFVDSLGTVKEDTLQTIDHQPRSVRVDSDSVIIIGLDGAPLPGGGQP